MGPTCSPDSVCAAAPFMIVFFLMFGLFALIMTTFQIFLWWKIYSKAGYSGAFAFLMLLGPVGVIILLCILAFSKWPSMKIEE